MAKKATLIIFSLLIFNLITSCAQTKNGITSETDSNNAYYSEKEKLNLTLTENSFGPLQLPYTEQSISLELLRGMFNDYLVKKGIGRQDGPNFLYYQILKGNDEIAFIKMDTDDTTKINRLFFRNAEIADEYGIKIGDTYKEIKKKRRNIKFLTYHFHTYVSIDNSNIGYKILGSHEGPDKENYAEVEILNWQVISLIWFNNMK